MPQTKRNIALKSRNPKGTTRSTLKAVVKKHKAAVQFGGPTFPKGFGGRAKEFSVIRAKLGISQPELSRLTGYSVRAIAGWEGGKALSGPAKQKIQETARLFKALSKIIPPTQCGEWMRTANSAFEGQTPIQIIERGESDRIWRMIFQIDASVAD